MERVTTALLLLLLPLLFFFFEDLLYCYCTNYICPFVKRPKLPSFPAAVQFNCNSTDCFTLMASFLWWAIW